MRGLASNEGSATASDAQELGARLRPIGACALRVNFFAWRVHHFGDRVVVEGMPLGARADVTGPRSGFADLPRREIHLYASEADWRARKPTLTVYYLGVPDTSPEFTSRAALDAYLASTERRGS